MIIQSYDEMSKILLVRYVAQGTLWKLGSMFQLSLEIFDTQLSKVIYTKRWQTQWDQLTTIKDDLSSNILVSRSNILGLLVSLFS